VIEYLTNQRARQPCISSDVYERIKHYRQSNPPARRGAGDLPPSSIIFCNSDSRIIVREPTLVRCNRPCESQACTVHFEIPPKRRAASETEIKVSKAFSLRHSAPSECS
jgi:hypothetical protein